MRSINFWFRCFRTYEKKVGYRVNIAYGDDTDPWDMVFEALEPAAIEKAEAELFESQGRQRPGGADRQCVAYERKMHDPGFASSPREVSVKESLVLFHYVTRSYEEFVASPEPSLTGVYDQMYRDVWNASRSAVEAAPDKDSGDDATQPKTDRRIEAKETFDAFEERHNFNLEGHEHPVCGSVVEAGYISKCCS